MWGMGIQPLLLYNVMKTHIRKGHSELKLNWFVCYFCDCIGRTVLRRIDWEEFEGYQNTFDFCCLRCINHMLFSSSYQQGSILMCCCAKQNKYYQYICKFWSVQSDRGHAPLGVDDIVLSVKSTLPFALFYIANCISDDLICSVFSFIISWTKDFFHWKLLTEKQKFL